MVLNFHTVAWGWGHLSRNRKRKVQSPLQSERTAIHILLSCWSSFTKQKGIKIPGWKWERKCKEYDLLLSGSRKSWLVAFALSSVSVFYWMAQMQKWINSTVQFPLHMWALLITLQSHQLILHSFWSKESCSYGCQETWLQWEHSLAHGRYGRPLKLRKALNLGLLLFSKCSSNSAVT